MSETMAIPEGLERQTDVFAKVKQLPEFWVAVRELKLSYHNPETILSTIYA